MAKRQPVHTPLELNPSMPDPDDSRESPKARRNCWYQLASPSAIPPRPLQQGVHLLLVADPCDIDGFLSGSAHSSLFEAFPKRRVNAGPRQDDQFRLKFPNELIGCLYSSDVSTLSETQTVDSAYAAWQA